jgi:hypothetical protein
MYKDEEDHRYDDIIELPHHVSSVHPHMMVSDRAAQFSPFAALTGYDAAVKETARLTNERVELDEEVRVKLDAKLQLIQEHIADRPEAAITYFKPDERKSGGVYVSQTGVVKKIDVYKRLIIMEDGIKIPIDEIIEIQSIQNVCRDVCE